MAYFMLNIKSDSHLKTDKVVVTST